MPTIANAKNGISSYEIHRAIGVTQKSAWFLLHRIRLAMKTGSFKKMEVAAPVESRRKAYVGGKIGNMHKSKRAALRAEAKKPGKPVRLGGSKGKAIIMGLLERGQGGKLAKCVPLRLKPPAVPTSPKSSKPTSIPAHSS